MKETITIDCIMFLDGGEEIFVMFCNEGTNRTIYERLAITQKERGWGMSGRELKG